MQGVNTYFERDMQFARKRPKSGGRELNFEHSDCFLDNLIYPFVGLTNGTQKSQNDTILDSHTDHKERVGGDYTPYE